MKKPTQELRFLVTQKCTNSCFFCHGEGLQTGKTDLMSAEDISFVFDVARFHFGCNRTTLTGGEPLLRPDIIDIAAKLYQNLGKVTLTTNGVLLADKINIGNYLERLNISIHSVDPHMYGVITKNRDAYPKMIYGLNQFKQRFPNVEIRVNATLLKGYNSAEDDIDDLLEFASKLNASVKFVELYPPTADEFIPVEEAECYLLRRGFGRISSTTRKKDYSNGFLEVGLTKIFCSSANDHDDPSAYCETNNDLFVSPDGKIKPCRHNPMEIDILPETKDRDSEGICQKLSRAFSLLGKHCYLLEPAKELSVGVKCVRV